jgi:malate synthase
MNSARIEETSPATAIRFNEAPADFDPELHLPRGFMEFLLPLHRELTPRQQAFIARRAEGLRASHKGRKPDYLPASEATTGDWQIELPSWCQDQRNQMTGPADDAELVVKMLNSGAPGVMLDLEDSMANFWPNLIQGIDNVLSAIRGELSYFDQKRNSQVRVENSNTVVFTRPRGLHLSQAGIVDDALMSASLFDVAMVAYQADPGRLRHPLCFYIPKSESADEALWWRDLFQAIESFRGWPRGYIKCMALVESHPIAYQMEEFIYNLQEHLIGLNLGRWDYMASLIHFNFESSDWILPDRNTIPHDVPFFQRLRELLAETCHKRGILAIGGMTALFPSRTDAALNERALKVLAADKKNEANCLMDGAWTGHPDQNEIAVKQFPHPNQLTRRKFGTAMQPDLRPAPKGVGKITLEGTRAAIRTVIRYRQGVLSGKGASLLDGYMEDLATDRIYRLMIAQRINHGEAIEAFDARGERVQHTAELITYLFDEELDRILREFPKESSEVEVERCREARRLSELMIHNGEFDPI